MSTPRTICRNCIFALYKDNIQYGCSIDRLTLLKNNGANLIDAMDETGKAFTVIDGMFCMYCRDLKWATKNKNFTNEGNIAYWKKIAREEMKMQYHALILNPSNKNNIKKTIDSLILQKLPPLYITLIRDNDSLKPSEIVILMKEYGTKIKWKIQNIVDNYEYPIDDAIRPVKLAYYAIFKAGFYVPQQLFSELDKKINDELFAFAIIKGNKEGNGTIVSNQIHHFLNGNKIKPLEEKLKENSWDNLIFNINKLFNFFPQ